jgi:hypothetical protein
MVVCAGWVPVVRDSESRTTVDTLVISRHCGGMASAFPGASARRWHSGCDFPRRLQSFLRVFDRAARPTLAALFLRLNGETMTEVMPLTLRYVLPISQHQLIVIQFYVQIYLQSYIFNQLFCILLT